MSDLETTTENELFEAMTVTELNAPEAETGIASGSYTKIPLSRFTALGTGFESVVTAVKQITSHGKAVSGYYKVTISPCTRLAKFKDGSGFTATAINKKGIAGQARLNRIYCDPTNAFCGSSTCKHRQKIRLNS